jgi:SAM-dependent methyltransferase
VKEVGKVGTVQVEGVERAAVAPDVAAASALLEIGERLGVLPLITDGAQANADAIAEAAALPVDGVLRYLEAMAHAGLVEPGDAPGEFRAAAALPGLRHDAGYVSWAMTANRPLIEHAREFLTDAAAARAAHGRDMRQVAVSSRWMGSRGFYPETLEAVVAARPRHFVDLGAGSGQLAIEVLRAFPGSTALVVDRAPDACDEARHAAAEAGVGNRLIVAERPVECVADDPTTVAGADVVHAGFVLHNLAPDAAGRVLRRCREALGAEGAMVVTEIVPYAGGERERRFSAVVTYLHEQFMGRRLLTAAEWKAALRDAGFTSVVCRVLTYPAGRQFVATG